MDSLSRGSSRGKENNIRDIVCAKLYYYKNMKGKIKEREKWILNAHKKRVRSFYIGTLKKYV